MRRAEGKGASFDSLEVRPLEHELHVDVGADGERLDPVLAVLDEAEHLKVEVGRRSVPRNIKKEGRREVAR